MVTYQRKCGFHHKHKADLTETTRLHLEDSGWHICKALQGTSSSLADLEGHPKTRNAVECCGMLWNATTPNCHVVNPRKTREAGWVAGPFRSWARKRGAEAGWILVTSTLVIWRPSKPSVNWWGPLGYWWPNRFGPENVGLIFPMK